MNANENIPCVSFESEDIVILSIGDFEIIKLENMKTFNINDESTSYNYTKIKNYNNENEHIKYCENATSMMTSTNYLLLKTEFGDFEHQVSFQTFTYENKDLSDFNVVKGEIEMSNFSVPFDFDGDLFLYLEFISKKTRKITVFSTLNKCVLFTKIIDEDFSHVSHMRFLGKNKIFLCKDLVDCEIRNLNENFELIEKWTHIGKDIEAVNVRKIKANEEFSREIAEFLVDYKMDDEEKKEEERGKKELKEIELTKINTIIQYNHNLNNLRDSNPKLNEKTHKKLLKKLNSKNNYENNTNALQPGII